MTEGTRTGTKWKTPNATCMIARPSSHGHSLVGFNRISWATHPYSSSYARADVFEYKVGISQSGRSVNWN